MRASEANEHTPMSEAHDDARRQLLNLLDEVLFRVRNIPTDGETMSVIIPWKLTKDIQETANRIGLVELPINYVGEPVPPPEDYERRLDFRDPYGIAHGYVTERRHRGELAERRFFQEDFTRLILAIESWFRLIRQDVEEQPANSEGDNRDGAPSPTERDFSRRCDVAGESVTPGERSKQGEQHEAGYHQKTHLIVAILSDHHCYSKGKNGMNDSPLGVNELHRRSARKNGDATVSAGLVSKFFKEHFGSHEKYEEVCMDRSRLWNALVKLNNEYAGLNPDIDLDQLRSG